MTETPTNPTDLALPEAEPAVVRQRLQALLGCYRQRRSGTAARLIAWYLDHLGVQAHTSIQPAEQAAYRRLARQWLVLAEEV